MTAQTTDVLVIGGQRRLLRRLAAHVVLRLRTPRQHRPSAVAGHPDPGALDPWYDRVEEALPVTRTDWPDVSYAGGVLVAACQRAGHTCNPVPVAVDTDTDTCTNCNWMLSGCRFDAKRSLVLNYLPAAEAHGADIRPLHEVQTVTPSPLSGYRYTVLDSYGCTAQAGIIHAKVVVLTAGAVGTPVILQRSALLLGGVPAAVGRYFSGNGNGNGNGNGDRVGVADVDEGKARSLLGLSRPDGSAYQRLPITAASYDHLDPTAPEYCRFTVEQIYSPRRPTCWPNWRDRPPGSAPRNGTCGPGGAPGSPCWP
ncbi:GMC family oxidoreductase N-terminal domain-containing protein [Streptomyces sp. CA-106131]|uniref:GMC family oxidoreductase N-terminal domain-containing protein n=1 Tax=Streptomyces sp. CA-106131 TaxID=3240045 RepID=UPI003D8C27BD